MTLQTGKEYTTPPSWNFPIKIDLEDHGQDLLTLLVDSDWVVIDANCQRDVWVGREINVDHLFQTFDSEPGRGCILNRRDGGDTGSLLNYRATKIFTDWPREFIL